MPTITQNYSQSIRLNGSGAGTVRFAPVGWNWTVQRITVKASSAVNEAEASIYRGLIGEPYRIGTSISASTGDADTEISEELTDGTPLIVVWSGGDANALATATIRVLQEDVP